MTIRNGRRLYGEVSVGDTAVSNIRNAGAVSIASTEVSIYRVQRYIQRARSTSLSFYPL